ncbi:interferon-inducible double-stranded RNA-dependent protein kinase activator A homolog [Anthonomus grandis grandis]|uniref:interferon-inducible double-stranded RNA-dependent protein kinase activator A homolog n=1 Tax=Anthonomus grandis grandis TaxID=2921223 RepID=UPI002165AA39|nr:interferon-inducible double-stranded RNA-dependent protein kinase activator A homolog [Anthonomus grandis grandis]XP_050313275.1 interferon-inducible double-stranded RNA-dependent protein kinase activator A homolog [Anthonomus grandis grandis]XP_050313276.1 interferon-inducible double-stranded RNA-dependent protein kinase activator A homolog [Anthonomus grandis grandis]
MAQDNSKTPSMVLHELMTKLGLSPPDYNLVFQLSGSHKNRFDFQVNAGGIQATGSGTSKQIGKQQAAKNALEKLAEIGIYKPINLPVSNTNEVALDCIVELHTLCLDNKMCPPEYFEISSVGPPHNKEFTYGCRIGSINTEATSSSKKMARRLAAKEMLERVKGICLELVQDEYTMALSLEDQSAEAKAKYMEVKEKILPDKTYTQNYTYNSFTKLMLSKELNYDDFASYLKTPTRESLEEITKKLDIEYILTLVQQNPLIVSLNLRVDMPCTIFARGNTFEEAEEKALKEIFNILDLLMTTDRYK